MGETAIFAAVAIGTAIAGTAVTVTNAQNQAKQAKLNAAAQATATANAAKEAADLELKQYEEQRQIVSDQAAADTAARLKAAEASRAALIAASGANGLDAFGPTGRALLAQDDADLSADLDTIKINAARSTSSIDYGERASKMRARNAVTGALTGAASTAAAANVSASGATYGAIASGIGSTARTSYGYLKNA